MPEPLNVHLTVTVKPAPLSRWEKFVRWTSFAITVAAILFAPSK